ncbi:hypothetical protein PHMEG_00034339 [Phytophthora megakarya]|uniref:Uncharacterized protein n=1 Tax=Phytophthora megakarya TaxID=4795 RepID=A0A225URM2_9STRA|nr:hypothetical protein PHMEG_00034339 [Phytophthora megakarya]
MVKNIQALADRLAQLENLKPQTPEILEHEKRRMQRAFDDKLAQQAQSADVGQKNWLMNAR